MKEILLTKGKVAIVDNCDYEWLMQWKWYHSNGYAIRSEYTVLPCGKKIWTTKRMHRIIAKAPDGIEVDHIDQDKLNNQKLNLRLCSRAENTRNTQSHSTNTSGFKGVNWHKKSKKWMAKINYNNNQFYLGVFVDKTEAAQVYNAAALKYHGEFAVLNQIPV